MKAVHQEADGVPEHAVAPLVEDMLLADRFQVVASPAPQCPPGEGGGVSNQVTRP